MPWSVQPVGANANQEVVAENNRRESLMVFNNGTSTIFISGNAAPLTDGIPLAPGAAMIFKKIEGDNVTERLYGQVAAGTGELRITEGVPVK